MSRMLKFKWHMVDWVTAPAIENCFGGECCSCLAKSPAWTQEHDCSQLPLEVQVNATAIVKPTHVRCMLFPNWEVVYISAQGSSGTPAANAKAGKQGQPRPSANSFGKRKRALAACHKEQKVCKTQGQLPPFEVMLGRVNGD